MTSLRAPLALALMLAAAPALACGTERWEVKVGRDADASAIVPIAVDATIALLGQVAAPVDPNRRPAGRWPEETVVYRVSGMMTLIKREADGDYHIVLSDGAGGTMIVEAPDPACAVGGRFGAEIAGARQVLDGWFGGAGRLRPNVPVIVTGPLFFDRCHGQEGRAPNCAELHPLLSIEAAPQ